MLVSQGFYDRAGAEYRSTQVTVHRRFVIPTEAGIQAVFLDSGQKIAAMTL
jgi:hypothetical protein